MPFSIRQYLVISLITGLSFAQGPAPDNHCHSDWIANDDLHSTCVCMVGDSGTCAVRELGTCHQLLKSASKLETGHENEGCTESNYGCDSCYLWFNELCTCLKNPGSCESSTSGAWIRLGSGKITTKQRMPGILQLASEEPWQLGQTLADFTSSKALVINSVKSRVQEQIHMHVCDVKPGVRDILGELWRSDYENNLNAVPNHDWMCRVQSNKGKPITGVTNDIKDWTVNDGDCANLVGAVVLIDSHDYTWTCLTTGYASAQGQFCAP